jgi:hypothetical protein
VVSLFVFVCLSFLLVLFQFTTCNLTLRPSLVRVPSMGGDGGGSGHGRVRELQRDGELEQELAKAGSKVVVVDFYADWFVLQMLCVLLRAHADRCRSPPTLVLVPSLLTLLLSCILAVGVVHASRSHRCSPPRVRSGPTWCSSR